MCYSIQIEKLTDAFISKRGIVALADAYSHYEQLTLADPIKYKPLAESSRIFPFYYAPVLYKNRAGQFLLEPMRYQAWPNSFYEDPKHLTLYNARLDNLRSHAWKGSFMQHHGVLVANRFFEWVQVRDLLEHSGNGISQVAIKKELDRRLNNRKNHTISSGKPFKLSKTEKMDLLDRKITIAFSRSNQKQSFLFPVVFSERLNVDGSLFKSFAVLTTDPPPIVLSTGHDRCPVSFQSRDEMDLFLAPWDSNQKTIEDLLHSQNAPSLQFALDTDL